jgi:2-dehydro-3-deoxyphosphooctonate aldolase (KDO 8-P synthase)
MPTAANAVKISSDVRVGGGGKLFLIAGPCVIESRNHAFALALYAKKVCAKLGLPFIFKASFDKANRSSADSFRGPGLKKGLAILADIKRELGVPILSDVHEAAQVDAAAEILDVLQIPAFLCRQTDLLLAAARTGKPVNIKKGPFLSPGEMKNAVDKVRSQGNDKIILTERGTTFGYNNLVVDFRSIPIMRSFGVPVAIDASHSVQQPGGQGAASGGEREFIPLIARAGVAAGADGVFLEIHDNPDKARSDKYNSFHINDLEALCRSLLRIREAL